MLHTYSQIARNYELWIEKFDPLTTADQFLEKSIRNKVEMLEQRFGPDQVITIDKIVTIGDRDYVVHSGELSLVKDWEQLENINPDMFQTYTSTDGEKRALIVK